MVGHGYHKVFGGLQHHAEFVSSLGLPAGAAYLSSLTEFFGGLMILAGLFTRLAAFAICIDLGVAIWKVHWHHGLMGEGGFEFPLAVATIAFTLIFFGGGLLHSTTSRAAAPGRKSKGRVKLEPALFLKTSCNYLHTPGFTSEDEQPVPLKGDFSGAGSVSRTHLNVAPPKTYDGYILSSQRFGGGILAIL